MSLILGYLLQVFAPITASILQYRREQPASPQHTTEESQVTSCTPLPITFSTSNTGPHAIAAPSTLGGKEAS